MIKSTLPNLRKTTRHLKTCADFTPEEMHQIFAVAQRFKVTEPPPHTHAASQSAAITPDHNFYLARASYSPSLRVLLPPRQRHALHSPTCYVPHIQQSNPKEFANCLKNKTMLMFFEKPSLRTRVSFETGMNLMGGHAIYYNIKDSPLGAKENVYDTISVNFPFLRPRALPVCPVQIFLPARGN